jgi:isocitrate/isopropylmalate dehydrogenase
VERAIEKVLRKPKLLTRDMGGAATTKELGGAIAEVVREV